MEYLALLLGLLLLALLVVDVFFTVFVPRGSAGPVTRRVYRALWRVWRRLSSHVPQRQRRRLLGLGGPLLLPLTVILWAFELVAAFALIYLPAQEQFSYPGEPQNGLLTAIYVSAYSATTLGVGDIYPQSALLRLLTVAEAGMGFALFTVAVTYALSVFGALQRTTAVALEVTRFLHLSDRDPLRVLAPASVHEGDFASWCGQVSSRLAEVAQSQQQYPLLEYFHVPDDDRALPVALTGLLEVLTVCRTVVDPDRLPRLSQAHRVEVALTTAAHHVQERAAAVPMGNARPQIPDDERRAGFQRARARLLQLQVPMRDTAAAEQHYVRLRRTWDDEAFTLCRHFGYEIG